MPAMLLFQLNGEFSCEVCQGFAGRLYVPGTEPQLPIHDNCDCSYAQVFIDEGDTDPDAPAMHTHPEIAALQADFAELLQAFMTLNDSIRDLIGHQVRGSNNQVGVFESADTIAGSSALTVAHPEGGDSSLYLKGTIDATVVIQAQNDSDAAAAVAAVRAHGAASRGAGVTASLEVLSTNTARTGYEGWGMLETGAGLPGLLITTVDGPIHFGANDTPIATDLATLLTALQGMNLVKAS